VRVAVLGRIALQERGHIGAAVILRPIVLAISDIDAREHQPLIGHLDHAQDRQANLQGQVLVLVVRYRRHDVDSVPNFVKAVRAGQRSLLLQAVD